MVVHVRAITFRGVSGRGPSAGELLDATVELWRREDRWSAPQAGRPTRRFRLREIGGPEHTGMRLDGSAIRHIVQAVSAAYAERKIAAVRAFVTQSAIDRLRSPESDGVLAVGVLEGTVARVRTLVRREDAEPLVDDPAHEWIRRASPVRTGDLVRLDAVNRYAYRLSRYPWRRVDAALSPADEEGQLTLDYHIQEAEPLLLYVQASNTGTDETGKWRERFGLRRRDLARGDDVLSVDYVTSDFDDLHALLASYEYPLTSTLRWKTFGTWHEYQARDVGFAEQDFRGESYGLGTELAWTVFQHRALFLDAAAGLRYRNTLVDNEFLLLRGETDFLLPYLALRAQRRTATASTSASCRIQWNLPHTAGTDELELLRLGRFAADERWTTLQGAVSHSFYLEPLLFPHWGEREGPATLAHEVAASVRGQVAWNDRRLPPDFVQSAGGFYSVRGYPEAFAFGDNAVTGTLEYRFHLPRALRPAKGPASLFGHSFHLRPPREGVRPDWDLIFRLFLDASRTSHNRRLPYERDLTLVGAGGGLELVVRRNLSIRLDLGSALKDADNGSEDVDAGEARVHISLLFLF
ncbi:MAG: hypothetical protein ACOC8A_01645 [bacterium]